MSTTVFALLVLSGAALYFMTPQERLRLARSILDFVKAAAGAATQPAAPGNPFDEFLRARTTRAVVTPLLVALNVLVFACMLFGTGALGDTQTLIDWGGNHAPRTTNGEWWRLIGSTFVHGGVLHLLATIAGLVPLGLVLERAVGRITFAAVYFAAGLTASVVGLWTTSPLSVSTGASGAVFGVYGLLLASLAFVLINRPEGPIPLLTVKRVAAAAVPFLLYNLLTDHIATTAELAGLGVGFAGGLLIARGVTRETPGLHRAAVLAAATAGIAIAAALPLRGIIDVRPEMAQVTAVEQRTAGAYEAAVGEFKLGRLPQKRLALLIDRTILPDLQGVRKRLNTLRGVPREQASLVEAAEKYFQLREQSWRRRSEALQRSNMNMLREAERTERAALEAFQKIQSSI